MIVRRKVGSCYRWKPSLAVSPVWNIYDLPSQPSAYGGVSQATCVNERTTTCPILSLPAFFFYSGLFLHELSGAALPRTKFTANIY